MTSLYAAHDDYAIYGLGSTAEEAVDDAMDQGSLDDPDRDGFQTSRISDDLADQVRRYGGDLAWDDADGILVPWGAS